MDVFFHFEIGIWKVLYCVMEKTLKMIFEITIFIMKKKNDKLVIRFMLLTVVNHCRLS